ATVADLRGSLAGSLRRVRLLQTQAGSAAAELRSAGQRLDEYQAALDVAKEHSQDAESRRAVIEMEVADVQTRRTELQREHLTTVRHMADLEAQQQRTVQKMAEFARLLDRLSRRSEEAKVAFAAANSEATKKAGRLERLDTQITGLAKQVELAEAKLQETRRNATRRRDEVTALNSRLEGVRQKLQVLQDLQRRQEGISGGIKTILARIQELAGQSSGQPNDWSESVHGMVVDCFGVDVKVAPLIDAALGDRTQYLVVTGDSVQRAILDKTINIDSRVGLIRMDELPGRRPGDRIRLDGIKGVISRADRMIQCEDTYASLARHLLSNTWVVDSLETAFGLRKLSGAGLRFVAATGELLESDGTTVVGPAGMSTGLVSRRSELESAQKDQQHYRFQHEEAEKEAGRLAAIVDERAAELGRLEQNHRDLVTERAAADAEARHAREALADCETKLGEIEAERMAIVGQQEASASEDHSLAKRIDEARQKIESLELLAAETDESLSGAQQALQDATAEVMGLSIDVARAEQKHEALLATIQQRQRDQGQREAAVAEVRDQANSTRGRISDANARILDANGRLSVLNWDVQQQDVVIRRLAESAAEVRRRTKSVQKESEASIQEVSKSTQQVHAITSTRDNAKLRRETLADRMLEDYEIDLRGSERPDDLQAPDDREAVDREIAELRNQIQKTGSVNLEALEELEDLQTRYDELHSQYQDLTAAKDSLQRIIGRINADSRRLFMDTLEAIRTNFRSLYRKSFGGGTADLILEEDEDPLEAGVEIVATPPGKPSFSNSLLSGGEKALTAVALLMAIFQYRPSPFCVLDEVDAPFDEANIGRFVTVLTEFLDQTKFVVVTHSKKTMTAATTLYGVTMQESGVSKQVSIRFEDVSDDGHISTGGEAA
ncbi:MAG: chromosome segregation protein SMC, partial [Planctomycetota bacterium]